MILVEIINLYKKQTELINLSSVCPQSETAIRLINEWLFFIGF